MKPKHFWVVMKVQNWGSLEVVGRTLAAPPEGPQGFLAVFDTKKQAVKWSGSSKHVKKIIEVKP